MGRPADARQRMVDAAVTLFGRAGFTQISLLDVAQHAKAPRGSIYYHFPRGKEEVADEVIAAYRYRIERRAAQLASREVTPEEFLRAIVDDSRKMVVSSDFRDGCAMAGIISNIGGARDEPLRTGVGATITAWVEALVVGLVSKGVDPMTARQAARAVVIGIEGAIVVSRATRDAAAFADVHDMVGRVLACTRSIG